MYQSWKNNPSSVDTGWQKFFEGFDFAHSFNGQAKPASGSGLTDAKEIAVRNYITAWRTRGHLQSKTNPVRPRRNRNARLALSDFGLTETDLDSSFEIGAEIGIGKATLRQIDAQLKKTYEGSIGFEFMYIREPDIIDWFLQKVEKEFPAFNPPTDYKKRVLSKLNEAVVFESFLHTRFVGQKRFSLEGGESTIPALDAIINEGAEWGAEEVVIGMAHRGRLNVLCNTMGKTYEQIFSEFEGNAIIDETMGDGDVKYHMGYLSHTTTETGKQVKLKLVPNPSHLEAVDSVVEGYARAQIEGVYNGDIDKIIPILIHGDAAVAGQGIVYELVQMSKLEGYHTGGTIHFVINNQVGFTTDFDDARSSIYCTDVAKIIDAPVLHVNGDDPVAVVYACRLATEYRQKFNRDIFIDMVCYRRHGHNESDEPRFTQPKLYSYITGHPNPRDIFSKKLSEAGEVDAALGQQMDQEFRNMLQDRLNQVKQQPLPYSYHKLEEEWKQLRKATAQDFSESPATGIDVTTIEKVGKALVTLPEGFQPLKQIEALIKDRQKMFFETKQLNWAAAELLAYGSILAENKVVRMSGQDVERGTFSHRHAVVTNAETNEPYINLNFIQPEQQKLQIYNSLLSEYGVLGFEFGYALANPHTLTLWEAQFGDFANGAQVMIDQFISCSETKWQRMNGLTLLLPHGYEGQGPEHSSARLERFLQLCAEHNIVVANLTTPANIFHALRRQLAWPFRKPLVIMSPKSMLRHPLAVSDISEFMPGTKFQELIPDTLVKGKSVKKVLLCSGKVYYDLLDYREKNKKKDVAIIRIEQLYPFPSEQLEKALSGMAKTVQLMWVQEEPENMGALQFVLHTLRSKAVDFVARKMSASPATGFPKVHAAELKDLLDRAFA